MRPVVLAILLTMGAALPPTDPAPPCARELTLEQFDKVAKAIRPKSGEEPWADVPWFVQLGEARKAAAEAGKPILLWEMDGSPLGCT